jgi:hypothetical protein
MHELSGAACLGRPPNVSECPALVLSADPCRCTLSLTQINDPRPAYASALVLSSQSVLCNLHCTYSVHIQRYFHHSRLHGPESSAPSISPYVPSQRQKHSCISLVAGPRETLDSRLQSATASPSPQQRHAASERNGCSRQVHNRFGTGPDVFRRTNPSLKCGSVLKPYSTPLRGTLG